MGSPRNSSNIEIRRRQEQTKCHFKWEIIYITVRSFITFSVQKTKKQMKEVEYGKMPLSFLWYMKDKCDFVFMNIFWNVLFISQTNGLWGKTTFIFWVNFGQQKWGEKKLQSIQKEYEMNNNSSIILTFFYINA